jgi:geranyl-CoA carboxylase alpha subunit
MPQTGPVLAWSPDSASRCDHALQPGGEVSPWYDSLLAKVIVHADSREAACHRLADALARTELIGFEHNGLYLQRIASHPDFQAGEFGTGFLAQHAEQLLLPRDVKHESAVAAVFLATQGNAAPAWPEALGGFSSTRALPRLLSLKWHGKTHRLRVAAAASSIGVQTEQGESLVVTDWRCDHNGRNSHLVTATVNGQAGRYTVIRMNNGLWIRQSLSPQSLLVEDESLLGLSASVEGVFQPVISSPMNGKITQVLVEAGQRVEAGTVLVCLEAMKMEHRIAAKFPAIVEQVCVNVGDQMRLKQPLVQLKPV